jgi:predicted RNA-binding protein with PUA domain
MNNLDDRNRGDRASRIRQQALGVHLTPPSSLRSAAIAVCLIQRPQHNANPNATAECHELREDQIDTVHLTPPRA